MCVKTGKARTGPLARPRQAGRPDGVSCAAARRRSIEDTLWLCGEAGERIACLPGQAVCTSTAAKLCTGLCSRAVISAVIRALVSKYTAAVYHCHGCFLPSLPCAANRPGPTRTLTHHHSERPLANGPLHMWGLFINGDWCIF